MISVFKLPHLLILANNHQIPTSKDRLSQRHYWSEEEVVFPKFMEFSLI